jgi:hypothetical protein
MSMPRPTVDLAHALPRRAIAVRPPPTVGPLATLGLFALLLGVLGGVLWWLGPDVVRDWRIRGDAVAASEMRIEQGRCRSWLAIIKVCDVTYANGADGSTRRLWSLFFGVSGEERMELLRSRSDPAQVSTRLGLERLYNRSIALTLLTAVLAFCIGAAVQVVHKGMRLQRAFAAMSGQRLTPVAVEIERKNIVPPRRRMWVYLYDDGGRAGRAVVELSSKDSLVFLTADERWALALRGEQGGTPLLLDAQLTCLDLTEAEKATFKEACRAAFRG